MSKYSIGVRGDFIAQHYLVGGDFGAESEKHSHHYVVEVIVEGNELDEYGFVVDIVRLKVILEESVNHYRDRTLNDLHEFKDINPGSEVFAQVLAERFRVALKDTLIVALTVKLWEDEAAWASCRLNNL